MFYDVQLLNWQSKGAIAIAWTAATVGISKVFKIHGSKVIINIEIQSLCNDILKHIHAKKASERFSLRLAIYIAHGTFLLLEKQVLIFIDDFWKFLQLTQISSVLTYPEEEELSVKSTQRVASTPSTPVIRSKRKRSSKTTALLRTEQFPEELPQIEDDIKEILSVLDSAEKFKRITLTEDTQFEGRAGYQDDHFGEHIQLSEKSDDFKKPFTPKKRRTELNQPESEDMPTMPTIASTPLRPLEPLEKSELEKLLSTPTKRKFSPIEDDKISARARKTFRKKSSASPEEGDQVIQVCVDIHQTFLQGESEIIQEGPVTRLRKGKPVVPEKLIEAIPTPQKVLEPDETYIEGAEKGLEKRVEKLPKQGKFSIPKELKVQLKKGPSVNLQCEREPFGRKIEHEELEYIDDINIVSDELEAFLSLLSPEKVLRTSKRKDESEISGLRAISSTSLSPIERLRRVRESKRTQTPTFPIGISPLVATPSIVVTDTEAKSTYSPLEVPELQGIPESQFIEQEFIQPEDVCRPSKKSKIREKNGDEQYTWSAEQMQLRREIIEFVENWNNFEKLTIDHLIPLPKNRFNAARTFYMLLELVKERLVKLESNEETLEISNILEGSLLKL